MLQRRARVVMVVATVDVGCRMGTVLPRLMMALLVSQKVVG